MIATVRAQTAHGKGLLAADESVGTCNRRLAELGFAQTEKTRRRYRELLVSGAILFDEVVQQRTGNGTPFVDVLQYADGLPA